jgi:hypothetical protein
LTTKSQIIADDIAALLRARNPLIWVVTREEARVEGYLMAAAAAAGYTPLMWDCAQGITDIKGKSASIGLAGADIGQALGNITTKAQTPVVDGVKPDRNAWILRDLHKWVEGPIGISTCRQIRNLAKMLPGVPNPKSQAMIVLSPSKEIPPELAGHTTVIDWPLPDRAEIGDILDAAIEVLPENDKDGKPVREPARPKNGEREAAIDAAVGLSQEEAQACFSKSLVKNRRIDPAVIAQEKKGIIAKDGTLTWYDPIKGGLDAVGGLENLKAWLVRRRLAYSPKARAYGLPAPKGAFLCGISGCGKTLVAKAVATAFGVPLIKVDLGALQSKFIGESQQNIRKAFGVIEAIGPCVVLIDEIEKAMAGATQGAADGGVSADQLGTFLTWMQDRKGEAFVIATANDISSILNNAPEMLRKGRFDEVFFVDLPNEEERAAVLVAAFKTHGREELIDTDVPEEIAGLTSGWTGSEIAELVPAAMFTAFADGERDLSMLDLMSEIKNVVPLSKTAGETINKLRTWAKDNARPATKPKEVADTNVSGARVLEF